LEGKSIHVSLLRMVGRCALASGLTDAAPPQRKHRAGW
jgi:hypothetical protein